MLQQLKSNVYIFEIVELTKAAIRMKRVFTVILLVGNIMIACKGKKDDPKKNQAPPPPTVDVIIVSPQSISNTVEANGSVVSGEYVEIRPEISGRLTYLNVNEGSRIAKGSVIAKINDADLRAQLNKVRVQLSLAQTTVERYSKLLEIQGINRADYDIALNQVNSLRADIGIIQADIAKQLFVHPLPVWLV
jgi:membrane fusion protein (multidrug efflux system)